MLDFILVQYRKISHAETRPATGIHFVGHTHNGDCKTIIPNGIKRGIDFKWFGIVPIGNGWIGVAIGGKIPVVCVRRIIWRRCLPNNQHWAIDINEINLAL